MTIYSLVALVAASGAVALFVRPRRSREWIDLVAAPLLALGLLLVFRGGRVRIEAPNLIDAVFCAVVAIALWLAISRRGRRLLLQWKWSGSAHPSEPR